MKLLNCGNEYDFPQADPFIFAHNGKYYLYCTGEKGVRVFYSDSLLSGWQYYGYALCEPNQKEYWAPCLLEEKGVFYMYYSSMERSQTDVHQQRIRVAVSDNPLCGFAYKKDLIQPFSIDPHVVRNECGLYIFYCQNKYEGDKVGTYIVVDQMTDCMHCLGRENPVLLPSLPQEIFQKDRFKKGQDWYTLEGACYFYHQGRHYCMYSGNNYQKKDYFVGYAISDQPTMRLNQLQFAKFPSNDEYAPLLCADNVRQSTGHNSVICVDNQYYVVFHARDVGQGCNAPRTARICRLLIDNKQLRTEEI